MEEDFFEYVREIKEYFDHCQGLTWLAQVLTKAALSLPSSAGQGEKTQQKAFGSGQGQGEITQQLPQWKTDLILGI